jgi:hypothetical protein
MMFDLSNYIPRRDSLHYVGTEDPYRVAWEAAATMPVTQAIAAVADRCGMPLQEASLLVFCELSEVEPVVPAGCDSSL